MQVVDCKTHFNQLRLKVKTLSARIAWWTPAFLLFVLLAVPAHAQFRTSIQGVVTDPNAAVIPGATLTLTDLATNKTIVQTSNGEGIFNFNALPASHFTLVVEQQGFKKKILNDLQLIPEQPNALNVQLELGAVTQSVSVNASLTPSVDTETADNGRTISENEVEHMPIFQRDATGLIRTAPGVIADGAQGAGGGGYGAPGNKGQTSASFGGGGNVGTSSSIFATESGMSANSNGSEYQNNGITVDGISTVSAAWGGATIITPSMESVDNIKIVTNAYDAENGRFAGALTEITSKSGSNTIHGSIAAQIVRPGLNAYQRWNGISSEGSGTPDARGLLRDKDQYNQFAGSAGGPIWKNKVFGFFAYEGQSSNSPTGGPGWYITPSLATLAPANSIAHTYLTYAGATTVTGTLITGATCATAQISSAYCADVSGGLNIGSPLTTALGTQDPNYLNANTPGNGNGLSAVADIAEYNMNQPKTSDLKQYNGRLDADVTRSDHLSFAMYWVPESFTKYNGGYGYDIWHHSQVNQANSLIWNHTFSPTFLNEARANAAGWRYNEQTANPQAPFGLPPSAVNGIGGITIGGFGPGQPSHYDQWTYSYKDVATKVLHSHTMKFGADLTRLHYLNAPAEAPGYSFFNLWDFMNDAPSGEYGNFQATTGIPGGFRNDLREDMLGIFYQDSWKLRPNLTINAGLRYSYIGPVTDKDKNMGTLLYGSGSSYLTGIKIQPGIGAWTAQKMNFGPQLGFNWAPGYFKSKMVVRSGFGLNYNQVQIANSNNMINNPPGANWMWDMNNTTVAQAQNDTLLKYAISSSPTDVFGYPANTKMITTFNSAGLPNSGNTTLSGLGQNDLHTTYYEHYSLDVEYSLPYALVANLGYTGSVGRHIPMVDNGNEEGVLKGGALNPLVPGITNFTVGGRSHNSMLLAGVKHQFSHTFSAEAQYAWGKSMDTMSGAYKVAEYLYDMKLNYGRSDFDIAHSLKVFGTWQPVLFHGNNAWAEKVAGGWTLSGMWTYHTGYGWTPTFNHNHNFICNECTQWGVTSLRPHYKGTGGNSTSNKAFEHGTNFSTPGTVNTGTPITLGCNTNVTHYVFDNNYFSIPDFRSLITDCNGEVNMTMPAPGMERNQFHGPGYKDVDLNIAKSFGLPNMKVLGDNAKLEIKAEMLNFFNFTNIDPATIQGDIENQSFGQASNALGARTIDFQARFNF
jgi:hypothetical protein